MATFKFYLTNPAGKSEARLFLKIFHKGSTIRITTPHTVPVKRWRVEHQKLGSIKKTTPQETLINEHLEAIKERAEEYFIKSLTQGRIPSKEEIEKAVLEKKDEPEIIASPLPNFEDLFKQFYDSPSLSSHQKRRASTTRAYKPVITKLKAYAEYNPEFKLSFESFDKNFYYDFSSYLEDEGLENNTIGSYFKRIKAFLSWAQENGYHSKSDYKRYKVLKEEKPVIFLNEQELNRLIEIDLSKDRRLAEARDLFVLQCVTGLRVSDLMALDPKHVIENSIHLRSLKTSKLLIVPLPKHGQAIISKYPDGLPKKSQQKYNKGLKDLAELAELDRNVEKQKISGNKSEPSFMPLSDAISSHTGRRTFITLSLRKKMQPHLVMGITGHKDLKTMYRYIGYTEDEKTKAMQLAWDK